ncbi:MAG: hypothetical protein ACRCSF_09860 [Mycobacteriaceae bacterium]
MKLIRIAAALLGAGVIAGATAGTASADPFYTPPGYTTYGITLSTSQTAWVAQNGIGNLISTLPEIPNFIYSQWLGRTIQADAQFASEIGTCIGFGIELPDDYLSGATNYVVTWWMPERCAP